MSVVIFTIPTIGLFCCSAATQFVARGCWTLIDQYQTIIGILMYAAFQALLSVDINIYHPLWLALLVLYCNSNIFFKGDIVKTWNQAKYLWSGRVNKLTISNFQEILKVSWKLKMVNGCMLYNTHIDNGPTSNVSHKCKSTTSTRNLLLHGRSSRSPRMLRLSVWNSRCYWNVAKAFCTYRFHFLVRSTNP